MAEASYNDIQFSMIHVVQFDQAAVYDPSSTDYIYTKVTVAFDAIFSLDPSQPTDIATTEYLDPSDPVAGDRNVADTDVRVRMALNTPRQRFLFQDGTVQEQTSLLDVWGNAAAITTQRALNNMDAQLDVKNGPWPHVISLKRFDGGASYHVSFVCVVFILECPGASATQQWVLSHRWTESLTLDKTFRATYSRTGRVIVSTLINTTSSADTVGRSITLIPLRNGFQRAKSEYTLSEDCLTLSYTVQDVQIHRATPAPALTAEGTYTESTGLVPEWREFRCRVRLVGAPGGDQQALLDTAFVVCASRVGSLAGTIYSWVTNADVLLNWLGYTVQPKVKNISSGILKRCSITQHLYENVVEVELEGQKKVPKTNNVGVPFNVRKFIIAPTDSALSGQMPLPNLAGLQTDSRINQPTPQIYLLGAALGVPCKNLTQPPPSSPTTTPGQMPTGPIPNVTIGQVAAAAGPNAIINLANIKGAELAKFVDGQTETNRVDNSPHTSGIYNDYFIRSYYRDRENIVASPNSTPSGGPEKTSICQWANPMTDLVVEWTANQVGDWPKVPSKESEDDNLVLIEAQVWPEAPGIQGDMTTLVYSISGQYVYAVIEQDELQMQSGIVPWMDTTAYPASPIPDDIFTPKIMNPPTGGGTSGSVNITIEPAGGGFSGFLGTGGGGGSSGG